MPPPNTRVAKTVGADRSAMPCRPASAMLQLKGEFTGCAHDEHEQRPSEANAMLSSSETMPPEGRQSIRGY